MRSDPSRLLALVPLCLAILIGLTSCSSGPRAQGARPKLLAHRGLAQTFDIGKVKADTNTASIIYPPEHDYIENTLESMKISFDYGADIVEFDLRLTKDDRLAVFHDYCLDYRTNAKGKVSDYTLAELKGLDVGYGYTDDGGKTYPLRGLGQGKLPSVDEVLEAFPDRDFLIHIRDDGEKIGKLLAEEFASLPEGQVDCLSIYGNDEAIKILKAKFPRMKALSVRTIKKAFIEYELVGWLGVVPASMRNAELHMPLKYARLLWGWPEAFLARMERVNTRFVLVNGGGEWSEGFDTIEDLEKLPPGYSGYLWTERIDRIGGYYKQGS
jgi:glycerophosphoryl diester phosphodiesterase